MAIVGWPEDVPAPDSVECAICKQYKPPTEVSAGIYTAQGGQAFACNSHFWDMGRLILGWADFATAQRQALGLDKANRGGTYEFPLY